MDNLSGQIIKGYELRERIGAGGFGAVYRAYQSDRWARSGDQDHLAGFCQPSGFHPPLRSRSADHRAVGTSAHRAAV